VPQLRIRIVGERLPGRSVGEHHNVHIGVQKGDEVVDLVPGDAPSAKFDVSVMRREDGDFRSPYVHGKPGDRFLYLSWVDVDDAGQATMFSRIKIMLAAIPAGLLRPETTELEAYVSLTDEKGKLVTAALRPPQITWTSA
jgi:hypothetical protein